MQPNLPKKVGFLKQAGITIAMNRP